MAIIKEKGLIKADDPLLKSGFSVRTMIKFRKLKKNENFNHINKKFGNCLDIYFKRSENQNP